MAGVLPPTGGIVSLSGTPVTGPRREVGMLFTRTPLFPWRTTLENVVLPVEIRGGRQAAPGKQQEARSLLEQVGLSGVVNAYPSELSDGMVQRAAFCRMLITDPTVLLLDEPFSALDEPSRNFMKLQLQCAWMERNVTALLVTESIPEAVLLSDVVFVMSPSPGRFIDAVQIDLPRPRTLRMVSEPCFGQHIDLVRCKLEEAEGIPAAEPARPN
jgi:NitT/TauT family transport system ATP-binding protein